MESPHKPQKPTCVCVYVCLIFLLSFVQFYNIILKQKMFFFMGKIFSILSLYIYIYIYLYMCVCFCELRSSVAAWQMAE